MSPSPSRAEIHFLNLGIQYYVAGRSAALARLYPVAANLYHHAIEMLLKARLCHSHTLQELRRPPFRHCLQGSWAAFTSEFPGVGLGQFDDTITALDAFENLRYPDNVIQEGAAIHAQWQPCDVTGSEVGTTPCYILVITDLDRLVARIFEVSSRNPRFYTGGMNEYARNAILHHNPACGGWFE